MKIVIAKAQTRLGLYNNPNGQEDRNIGVEDAPSRVISAALISNLKQKFESIEIIEKTFSQPETVKKEDYLQTMYKESTEFAREIQNTTNQEDILISVGGDHSMSLGSIHAVCEIHGIENIGFIQIDSHADIHLVKTSPTGNFHGMYVRPIFSSFDFSPINTMFMKKAKPKQLIYMGNLDLEKEEQDFIHMHRIRVIDKTELIMKQSQIADELKLFCTQFSHIHVGLDVDVFDKTEVQATGIPAESGLLTTEVFPIIQTIAQNTKSKSMDVVEVNPSKNGAFETISIAQKAIQHFLSTDI